jgi:putative oxygen-independent coproporphyrinogen III oxidase
VNQDSLALYVHWPFCLAKCPYCDFNSHVRHGGVDQARFARALAAEVGFEADRLGRRCVETVFFGGGTPSLMAPETVETVLGAVRARFDLADNAEITMEANPTSVEAGRFRAYRDLGVNRVSIGVQALDDAALARLGRRHSAAEARAAVAFAVEVFPRVSFDLIYARPEQSLQAWRRELVEALALQAGHLSLYQLTIEEGTPFAALHAAGRLPVPDADLAADFYELTQEMTEAAGLPAYEVSNHARPGEQSRHNLAYWTYRDYAGIGPGAHGRLTFGGMRRATYRLARPEDWAQAVEQRGSGLAEESVIASAEAADEMLLMGLRLSAGIDMRRYEALGGAPLDSQTLAALTFAGLVETDGDRLRATPSGRLVLNTLVAELSAPHPARDAA